MSNEIFDKFGNDPIALCNAWYEEAEKTEPNDPEAVTLATATPDGKPSLRWVLIKEINDKGFKFHTNSNSRKGAEIAANPHAALCFYWKSTRKQIRIEGRVETVSKAESDAYFASRSRARQIGAWASNQSQPFDKIEEIETALAKTEARFANISQIPRPPHWQGYRLFPELMEFWIAHKDRLHTRFVYSKGKDGAWKARWLYP